MAGTFVKGLTLVKGLTGRERVIYGGLSPVFGRNVARQAELIRERATWSVERLEQFRVARFREILMHAASTVPYYTKLFAAAGFDAAGFQSFQQLESIPSLTRELVRERFADLRSTVVPDEAVVRRSTGGTSGAPVTVLLDRAGDVERMLVNHRMYALMNRTLGTPTLMIAGSPIDSVAWTTLRDRVKNRVFGIEVASSFNLTTAALGEIVQRLQTGRYGWVIAYASVFDILAAHVAGNDRQLRIPNIIPCAELVSDAQRERWRDAFGAAVFEIYGSREMTSIAGELPDHRNMAVATDVYHLEILDEEGRALPHGQPGLITISTLCERGMPLIRYQLGDVGVLEPPPAGSPIPFPRLRITHGRVLDVICCPNGKMLPGEFFPHLMKEVESSVHRFQVVQTEIDRLVVRLVPRPTFEPSIQEYLRGHIQSQVGDEVRIEFELVDEIELSTSGKYRPTISLLPASEKRFGS
jgi:phenylacetate-CoA ligase